MLVMCIFPFRMLKKVDVLIQEPSMVGENLTNPTLGRLVFGIAAIVLGLFFPRTASKAAEKNKHYASSFLGFAAGILLWQFIGEISWHYSIVGVHFVPFESVTTFPVACLLMTYISIGVIAFGLIEG